LKVGPRLIALARRSFLAHAPRASRVSFETLPLVHLERGRFPEYPAADPSVVLTRLAARFGRIVLVDAGGVRANDADLEFIQEAGRKRTLWVDAGSRYATDAMDLFVAGAETVTMRWNTLRRASELEEAAAIAQEGALYVGLEFPHGKFLPHPQDARSATQVAQLAQDLGIGLVFLTDKADADVVRHFPSSTTPRWLQGASSHLASELQTWGYQGAIVGPIDLTEEAKA